MKTAHIQVRVSVEEKAAWTRWAADEGVSLSELIRRVMVARLEVPFADYDGPVSRMRVSAVTVRPAGLPSAVQVAKRSFKPDFK